MKLLIERMCVSAFVLIFAGVSAIHADVELMEDFESYTVGSTIHEQGGWVEQKNGGMAGPHGGSFVVAEGAGQALQLTNQDCVNNAGECDTDTLFTTNSTFFDINTETGTGLGTVYYKFMMEKTTSLGIIGLNKDPARADDEFNGWNAQKANMNNSQATLTQLKNTGEIRPMFKETDPTSIIQAGEWYELWTQINLNTQTWQTFISGPGFTDHTLLETLDTSVATGDVYNFRTTNYAHHDKIQSIVLMCIAAADGAYYIDDLGVDNTALSLNSVTGIVNTCETVNAALGDFNCDGNIDLTDLVTLGENYNQPGDYTKGDTNKDGDINLTDLVTLGENYNTSVATPEPASLGLLAIGGLLAIRRH